MHTATSPGFRPTSFGSRPVRVVAEPGHGHAQHPHLSITVEPSHIHIPRPGRVMQLAVEETGRNRAAFRAFA